METNAENEPCFSPNLGGFFTYDRIAFFLMKNKPETISFTQKEAKELLAEIASVAEAAYRRGVQQAGAFGLSRQAATQRFLLDLHLTDIWPGGLSIAR
jgi:hypothetical protein